METDPFVHGQRTPAHPDLSLSDDFVAVVLELAPDGIAVTDEMGLIMHANGCFEDLFGYRREQLVGHSVEMLMAEPVRSAHRKHRRNFGQLPLARPMGTGLDLWGLHADGTQFAVEVGLSPVSTVHGMRTIMAVRPITERRDGCGHTDAVQADRDRMALALNDRVIQSIFSAGLGLHGLIETATVRQLAVIYGAINNLDSAIRELRNIVFDQHHHDAWTTEAPAEDGRWAADDAVET